MIKFSVSLLGMGSLCLMGAAAPQVQTQHQPRVIYGEDNRQDPFEQKSQDLMLMRSRATALMVHKSQLEISTHLDGWEIPSTSYGEANQLCEGERFFSQPTADPGFCSSFLVDANTMVTAGHCISAWDCERVAFVFGFALEKADSQITHMTTDNLYECDSIVARQRAYGGLDYAVVRLKRPVLDREPLVLAPDESLSEGDPLTVIGYPMGLPVKISAGGVVRDNTKKEYFVANIDTFAGNSGSAVLNSVTGEVEGILVRGEGDFVVGEQSTDNGAMCFEEHRCPEDGCRGEDVTRTKQFRHVVWGTSTPDAPDASTGDPTLPLP